MKKTVYICDPAKNAECDKTGCKHNPNSVYPVCEYTDNPEYSVDGKPIEIKFLTRAEKFEELRDHVKWLNAQIAHNEMTLSGWKQQKDIALAELRKVCPHTDIERTPDPSGHTEGVCQICGKDMGRV